MDKKTIYERFTKYAEDKFPNETKQKQRAIARFYRDAYLYTNTDNQAERKQLKGRINTLRNSYKEFKFLKPLENLNLLL